MKTVNITVGLVTFILVISSAQSVPFNNTSDEECISRSDCDGEKICVDLKCVDPCAGVCGLNTICVLQDSRPVCACKPGHEGDPFTECKPGVNVECTQDMQCSLDKACVNNVCVDPCQGGCGLNTDCRVTNHRSVCACLRGFTLSPNAGCKSLSIPECQTNSHCSEDRVCRQQKCVDPCEEGLCGNNTLCSVKNHLPVCSCKIGYIGDAQHECTVTESDEPRKKTFFISDSTASWYDAINRCLSLNMTLATVMNEGEMNDLKEAYKAKHYPGEYIWLGGHDLGRYRQFFWASTGKKLSYTKWKENEPSGGQNHCLLSNINFLWVSFDCRYVYYYACELF